MAGYRSVGTSLLILFLTRSVHSIGLGDNFDPGPKAFPMGLSMLLLIGGLIELYKTRGTPSTTEAPKTETRAKTVLQLMGLFVIYVILIPWFGFSISSLVMATFMMVLLDNSWKLSLIVSIILIAVIYCLFVLLFKVPLPGGVFGMPF